MPDSLKIINEISGTTHTMSRSFRNPIDEMTEWKGENTSGYFVFDKVTGEIVEGERVINGIHQVWVHVPGEGDLGGHWEDDLDGDGVAASVDDDDNDPNVGDDDPDKP